MTDRSNRHDSGEDVMTSVVVDLHTQLNRAYLRGDGAAVEHVMTLIAAAEHRAQPNAAQPNAAQPNLSRP